MNAKIVAGFLSLLSLYALSCKKADFGEQVILATGTEVTPIVKFTVQNTPSEYLVTATATAKAISRFMETPLSPAVKHLFAPIARESIFIKEHGRTSIALRLRVARRALA